MANQNISEKPPRNRGATWIGLFFAFVVGAVLVLMFRDGSEEPPAEQVVKRAPPPKPAPKPVQKPAPRPVAQLPELGESDGFLRRRARDIIGGAQVSSWMSGSNMIRHFVAVVDGAARGEMIRKFLPKINLSRDFSIQKADEGVFYMAEESYARYDRVVELITAIPTDEAANLLRMIMPLMNIAYAELGSPSGTFQAAIDAALNHAIKAPVERGPLSLVQPSVMYQYADPRFEEMSDVHKQMLRIGPDNTQKLKNFLRALRSNLRTQ